MMRESHLKNVPYESTITIFEVASMILFLSNML